MLVARGCAGRLPSEPRLGEQAIRISRSSLTSAPRALHALSVCSAGNRMLRSARWASLNSARAATACPGSTYAAA